MVKNFEDGVVARSYQGGHVEHGADIGAPASDMALAAELAAVVVEWGDSRERGGLRIEREPSSGMRATNERAVTLPMPWTC